MNCSYQYNWNQPSVEPCIRGDVRDTAVVEYRRGKMLVYCRIAVLMNV